MLRFGTVTTFKNHNIESQTQHWKYAQQNLCSVVNSSAKFVACLKCGSFNIILHARSFTSNCIIILNRIFATHPTQADCSYCKLAQTGQINNIFNHLCEFLVQIWHKSVYFYTIIKMSVDIHLSYTWNTDSKVGQKR